MCIRDSYHAPTANDPALIRWLIDKRHTESTSELLTLDFIVQGTMGALAGGDAAWAFGYERRDYSVETTLPALQVLPAGNSMTNIHDGSLYPCDIPQNNETANGRAACASNPVGLFMF